MMLACDAGEKDCVKLLLDHQADTTVYLGEDMVEKDDPRTAMEFAVFGGASEDNPDAAKECERLLQERIDRDRKMVAIHAEGWAAKDSVIVLDESAESKLKKKG